MPSDPAFAKEQRGVVRGMAAAVAITALALGVAFGLAPAATDGPAERLAYAIRSDLVVVVWLAAAIANVARLRFFSATDIGGSAGPSAGDRVRTAGAILQNTLEQAVLAVLAHLGLAVAVGSYRTVVPVLVGLFCLGRLLFWAGYPRGAAARALGFGLTFYPSLAALGVAVTAAL